MTAPALRFVRVGRYDDHEYRVLMAGEGIGMVAKRRGGWWRAWTLDGTSIASWCVSRREAAALLADRVKGKGR